MRFVKEAGAFHLLNHYLRVALYLNILSISIYFIMPIIFYFQEMCDNKKWVYSVVILIVSFTWLANIRFSTLFIRLLTDPKENK